MNAHEAMFGLAALALYFDAKKVFLDKNATAALDGVPLKADIHINPVILGGGVSFYF
jgi:outer membrane protein W